jgi:P27 family predicted phage terminase small subunit
MVRRDPTARLAATPRPPAGLSSGARAIWRTLARDLVAAGLLTTLDLPLLRLLVEAIEVERTMAALLVAEGLTIAAGSGGRKAHPAIRAGAGARATVIRLADAFGMSPTARQRVEMAPPGRNARSDTSARWAQFRALQGGKGPSS